MLHVDIPSRSDIERLITVRTPACVSIYLGTSPITQDAQKSRIGLKNLARTGLEQLRAEDADKRVVAAIEEAIDDLIDDDDFWRFQANSLAVFATPDTTQTFRLPNRFEPMVEVSDRFYIKPLLRCITVPQTAFVLALAQGSVRLVEVSSEMPAFAVKVDGMPTDVASAVEKASAAIRRPRATRSLRRLRDASSMVCSGPRSKNFAVCSKPGPLKGERRRTLPTRRVPQPLGRWRCCSLISMKWFRDRLTTKAESSSAMRPRRSATAWSTRSLPAQC